MLITRTAGLSLASLLLWTGCSSSTISGHGEGTAGSSGAAPTSGLSSGTAAATSGGRTTQGTGSSTGNGSSAGNAASSSTSAGSSTGRPPAPPIVDGGYVFCAWPAAPQGARESWLCQPGTYLCDLSGDGGNCFQCQSDADCANEALPTYDPDRPHCDVTSGVPGYQGFCQQCVSNADCAGNPAGPVCNLNAPPDGPQPTIDLLGFEACGGATIDCREPSAAACGLNQTCNPVDGICTNRSATCSGDADCAGYFASQYVPAPYCVGATCSACPNASCGNGCTADHDCADAGLTCLQPGTPYSFCGLSCAAPEAPACPADLPRCESDSGLCQACTSDDQCPKASAPTCAPGGFCACTTDDECPSDQVCFPRDSFGNCAPLPEPGCTPRSCSSGDFCDWQSGTCVQPADTTLPCITDYDCSTVYESADFCVAGKCVGCRDDNDCIVSSSDQTDNDRILCYGNKCTESCGSNADCIGSSDGPTCVLYTDAGYGECQEDACVSNADCAGDPRGSYCDFDGGLFYLRPFGTCGCLMSSDCGPGMTCPYYGGYVSSCSPYCYLTPDCPPGYFCDPDYTCRPRCDDGGQCSAAQPICDQDNAEHQNGETLDGSVPGLVWCYGCLTSDDCPDGQGCGSEMDGTHACAPCQSGAECASGACFYGTCLKGCDAGACPAGQVCDTSGSASSFCYQCLGPIDCPDGQGCNSATHKCGTCTGPTSSGGPFDCPPGDFCSYYWSVNAPFSGACLQTCDARPCPADHPICQTLLPFSNDHRFCFGCLQDADCADAGPGAWCDTSVGLTFTCQLPVGQ